ncbi:MAG: hypothetical protein WDN45_08245 [Caulobacteraceae bacterium]
MVAKLREEGVENRHVVAYDLERCRVGVAAADANIAVVSAPCARAIRRRRPASNPYPHAAPIGPATPPGSRSATAPCCRSCPS